MKKIMWFLEGVVFVTLMALCCLGSLIWCWLYCFIASGGKERLGRYPVGKINAFNTD